MDELIRKQDAIEAINVWLYCDKDERMPADVIKALPPVYVPDTDVEDMISRQAVIDLLKQMRKDGNMVPWEGKNVFDRIRKLPPAQPKRGKWIERESDTEDKENGFETVIVCSCCDFPATTFYSEDCESRTQIRTDFCPNCGADMRGSKDGTD